MLKLKNQELVGCIALLEKLEFAPKASRVRTKLLKLFRGKAGELYQDELELLEKYGKKDNKGKLIENKGEYSLIEETAPEYHHEKQALLEEEIQVNVSEIQEKFNLLITALELSETTFSGQEAESLDLLLELLEEQANEERI